MTQKRPLLIRSLPHRFGLSLLYRYYLARRERWIFLYKNAPLRIPGISMDLVPGDVISDQIAFTGAYESELTERIITLGRRGGTMIDVGANLGYFSLLWAASKPSNRCIAFEAAPRNIRILRENVSRNGLEERIKIVPCAASAQPGKVRFDLGPDDQTGWGGITHNIQKESIEVEAVRVDEVLAPDEPIVLLKIDTEGADTLVLEGCERLLNRKMVREIWFEQNKPRMKLLGIGDGQAQAYLESVGYLCRPHGETHSDLVEWTAVPADSSGPRLNKV
jgi:FkbM family methyltransferase